jgi:hypothetical protein
MTKAIRVVSLALPLVLAAIAVSRQPTVVGAFSISSYGLV